MSVNIEIGGVGSVSKRNARSIHVCKYWMFCSQRGCLGISVIGLNTYGNDAPTCPIISDYSRRIAAAGLPGRSLWTDMEWNRPSEDENRFTAFQRHLNSITTKRSSAGITSLRCLLDKRSNNDVARAVRGVERT